MTIPQKTALDDFSKILLPQVDEEYRRRYGAQSSMWLQSGMLANQDMITTNINHLNREENDFRDKLKRWQELSPQLDEIFSTIRDTIHMHPVHRSSSETLHWLNR